MSGRGIRMYTDEDVHGNLARQLRSRGYDVVSCFEAGNDNRGLSDDWQLLHATQDRRAILVHNIRDYAVRDQVWKASGDEHYGIIAVPKRTPIGELVRRTCLYLDTIGPQAQYNMLLYLVHLLGSPSSVGG